MTTATSYSPEVHQPEMDAVLGVLPNHPHNLNASGISGLIYNVLELMRDNEHPPKSDNLALFTAAANTGLQGRQEKLGGLGHKI